MEQYFPRAHVGKERRGSLDKRNVVDLDGVKGPSGARTEVRYADIKRPVDLNEVAAVKKAAEEAGLWRFVEVAKHGGFNIQACIVRYFDLKSLRVVVATTCAFPDCRCG